MALPHAVQTYLDRHGLPHRLVPHPHTETLQQAAEASHITPRRLVRVVVLKDGQGLVMAILPASHILDFNRLCQISERELDPLYGDELNTFFKDCQPGSHPPLPGLFELPSLIDPSLAVPGELFFEAGDHDVLVGMDSEAFQTLVGPDACKGQFAHPVDALGHVEGVNGDPSQGISDAASRFAPRYLKEGIESLNELPALPITAQRILKWRANPKDNVEDELATIIEQDPSLAAQVIHWARSPFYGYRGKVDSVHAAIHRVLGFDMVMNLVLGLCVGGTFRVPLDGPLGLDAFWRHSVYCSALTMRLADCLPKDIRPKPGLAYLGGLLHNFGYLLLGHLFPSQFFLLNRYIAVNSHLPVGLVEHYVLGAEHFRIGAWLMRTWSMPEEIIAAVRWHHDEDYSRPHSEYPNLVLVANRLLRRHRIGDETTTDLPPAILSSLGISEELALEALDSLMERRTGLDDLSRSLAR